MKKIMLALWAFLLVFLFLLPSALAHVPYLERRDSTIKKPFQVRKSITQSIAVYSWLQTDWVTPSTDIDVYSFTITNKPLRVFLEVIVPVCGGFYANFTPWFALVGPGLPPPNQTLPFEIPHGYGVIVKQDAPPGSPREEFYEPFGGKSYYRGPGFDETLYLWGTYYVFYWDPYQKGGDYVAVLGYKEQFPPLDFIRALINTPLIRRGYELHVP
ncbi:MAG: hypothetical protein JW840_03060 [Candidatus Thermoplasmatota archaeon]|nr:hypothetical protein [Candidatus Thermoplasmatota archaeon]